MRPFAEVLRRRLRELAATHVRYGYQRLTVSLRREGYRVNAKRIYRRSADGVFADRGAMSSADQSA